VILLENLGSNQQQAKEIVQAVAQRILDKLGLVCQLQHAVPGSDNIHKIGYHITGSIGITVFNGQQVSRETLLSQADTAMYQAKQSGKNAAVVFTA